MTSPLEGDFEFDSNALMKHIQDNQLDAIAITNHNFFERLREFVWVEITSPPPFPAALVSGPST